MATTKSHPQVNAILILSTDEIYPFDYKECEQALTFFFDRLQCPKAAATSVPVEIKIDFCHANGPQFRNLRPGSIHRVVTPPDGYKNDHTGMWVMGVGEPVKVLTEEFSVIN